MDIYPEKWNLQVTREIVILIGDQLFEKDLKTPIISFEDYKRMVESELAKH